MKLQIGDLITFTYHGGWKVRQIIPATLEAPELLLLEAIFENTQDSGGLPYARHEKIRRVKADTERTAHIVTFSPNRE